MKSYNYIFIEKFMLDTNNKKITIIYMSGSDSIGNPILKNISNEEYHKLLKNERLVVDWFDLNELKHDESKVYCCHKCGSIDNLKICTKCKKIRYCSSTCQNNDWKKHKKVCSNITPTLFDNDEDNTKECMMKLFNITEEEETTKKAKDKFLDIVCNKPKRIPKKEMWKNPSNKKK